MQFATILVILRGVQFGFRALKLSNVFFDVNSAIFHQLEDHYSALWLIVRMLHQLIAWRDMTLWTPFILLPQKNETGSPFVLCKIIW